MEERPNYFAIIPANVRYDDNLTASEKLFYGEITALTYKTGECWATNTYFANLYGVSTRSITNWVSHLEKGNYIKTETFYKENSKEIEKRIIRLPIENNFYTYGKNFLEGYRKNNQEGIEKNFQENNTSNNNTSINKKEIYKEKFGEFKNVLLTPEEYQKLKDKDLLNYIDKLSLYIESKGAKYKSHYATILTWGRKDKKENNLPDWFNEEIKEEETSDEVKRMLEYVNGKD